MDGQEPPPLVKSKKIRLPEMFQEILRQQLNSTNLSFYDAMIVLPPWRGFHNFKLPCNNIKLMLAICTMVLLQRHPEKILIDHFGVLNPHVSIRLTFRTSMKRSTVVP